MIKFSSIKSFLDDLTPSIRATRRIIVYGGAIVIFGIYWSWQNREKIKSFKKGALQLHENIERLPIMEKKINQCVLDIDSNTNTVNELKRTHNEFQKTQKQFNERIDKNVKDVVKRTYSTKEYIKWLEQRDKDNTSYYDIADTNLIPF